MQNCISDLHAPAANSTSDHPNHQPRDHMPLLNNSSGTSETDLAILKYLKHPTEFCRLHAYLMWLEVQYEPAAISAVDNAVNEATGIIQTYLMKTDSNITGSGHGQDHDLLRPFKFCRLHTLLNWLESDPRGLLVTVRGAIDAVGKHVTFSPRDGNTAKDTYENVHGGSKICRYCGRTDTPKWRLGPDSSESLCDPSGERYAVCVKAMEP